jgi:membrane protein implicated in regulation of membrane protease activity|tara:strand:- start:209 stop:451 length:243 start_codon:yes stop_codon:yes gene_type:complete
MIANVKKLFIVIAGFTCLLIGLLFILLPGPAVIFLPLGLALLSLEYTWAKIWLKKAQKWLTKSAEKTDRAVAWLKRSLAK